MSSVLVALDDLGGEADRPDIVEQALEAGDFTDAQLAVPPPPTQVGRYETKLHYNLAWAIHLAKKEGSIEQVGRGRWRLR